VVLTHLGFAQLQLGQNADAVATFERARSMADGDVAYDSYLAQAYFSARRYDDARRVLEPLRASRPGDIRLAQLQARVLAASGHRDDAVAVMRQAISANPSETSGWLSLADLLSESSRIDEALQVLDEAATRFPQDVSVPFQRGALFERAKNYTQAEASFRDALAKDPLHGPTLNYLGYMLAERGTRLDEAVDLIQRALAIDPGNGSYLDSLGWAYYKQNKLELAREQLARAAEQLPANSVVQEHYGDALDALGRHQDAIAAWQRALGGDRDAIDVTAIERKIRRARERASR
jgi:tetratricopeptide (TPR) repeat protein